MTETEHLPAEEEREESGRYDGVLRYYELAKKAEWQVRDLPWGEQPPIPSTRAHRRSSRDAATSGVP